ncbi:hypothetical protein MPSEU_000324300 [Mayamaea pseudoterrestris]|nr:hypothetical protein MPSEU_000324300 [Mayamaea pseudoterrestris]
MTCDSSENADAAATATFKPFFLFKTILVFGAGESAVNGVYARRDDGFAMKGLYQNQDTTFTLSPCKCSRWHLKAQETDLQFYASNPASNWLVPPSRGWWCADASVATRPPILCFEPIKCTDWRRDPAESFSDYKIEIVYKSEAGQKLLTDYHVHRNVLANASHYFQQLLTVNAGDPTFAEGNDKTSRIDLDAAVADMFPNFLDFVYWSFGNGGDTDVVSPNTSERLVGMHWLADYFEVPALARELRRAIYVDLDASKAVGLIKAARAVDVHNLVDELVAHFAEYLLMDLDDNEVALFVTVLDEPTLKCLLFRTRSDIFSGVKASEILAKYCDCNDISASTFAALTTSTMLPYIGLGVVGALLRIERKLAAGTADNENPLSVSNLQKRCIEVLAENFDDFDSTEDGPLESQSPVFLRQLIRMSQKRIREDLPESSDEESGDEDGSDEEGGDNHEDEEMLGNDRGNDEEDGEDAEDASQNQEESSESERNVRRRIELELPNLTMQKHGLTN